MNEDKSLLAVVAHGLLNEITVVSGLLAQAREHLDPNTSENQRADDLLQACEAKTLAMVANLRRHVRGESDHRRPHHVIDLDQQPSDQTHPGPL